MFVRARQGAVPKFLMVASAIWLSVALLPFAYCLAFPNSDVDHILMALRGRETIEGDLGALVGRMIASMGRVRRALPVGAYLQMEYQGNAEHVTKTRKVSYLVWFEKQSKPTLLVIARSDLGESHYRFDIGAGGGLFAIVRSYALPIIALTGSIFWFLKDRQSGLNTPGHDGGSDLVHPSVKE